MQYGMDDSGFLTKKIPLLETKKPTGVFKENTRGLERKLVIRELINYLTLHQNTLTAEGDEAMGEYAPENHLSDEGSDEKSIASC
jgi:hypothetical protein